MDKIALIGKAGSGKDYVAEHLVFHYGFQRFAFADELKKVAFQLFPEAFSNGQKPRKLLQELGQKMRELDEEVWIRALMRQLKHKKPERVVVTDVRQTNEYIALMRAGFVMVKIDARDEVRLERLNRRGDRFTLDDLNHETERIIDSLPADYIFTNNGNGEDDILERMRWLVAGGDIDGC